MEEKLSIQFFVKISQMITARSEQPCRLWLLPSGSSTFGGPPSHTLHLLYFTLLFDKHLFTIYHLLCIWISQRWEVLVGIHLELLMHLQITSVQLALAVTEAHC